MQRRESWGFAVGLLALTALLVRSLLVVPYLPTNDGPEQVVASHIVAHFRDPGTVYADLLLPTLAFAERGFDLLFDPLQDFLGWRVGLQWSLAIIATTWAIGFTTLVCALNPARWPLAFAGFPLALSWHLYMGFFPFMVGSGVGLFILALAVRWRAPGALQRALLALLLLLQALCHVFSAALTGLVLGALLVSRAWCSSTGQRGRSTAREVAKVGLIGVPAACVLAATARVVGAGAHSPFETSFVRLPVADLPSILPRMLAPGPWWRALTVVALVGASAAIGARRLWTRDPDDTDRALWASGVVFLIAGACMPIHVPGWQYFSPRFFPLGTALCLATVPLEALSHRRAWSVLPVATAAFAITAVWLVASTGLHRRLAAACDDAIVGLSAPVQRHGLWLPMTLAPFGGLPTDPRQSEVPFLAPLLHLPALYAVAEGGLTPYTFARNAATYPFVFRGGTGRVPPVPMPAEFDALIGSQAFAVDTAVRARVVDRLARYGMRYEGILVTGARPADVAVITARGFATDWASGSVFIGHFVPCPLEVIIPPTGDVPMVDVEVGARDDAPNVLRYGAGASIDRADGLRHVLLPDAPCGSVRVRPHWDTTTEDGTVVQAFCGNARRSGDLIATLTWAAATVDCAPRPARVSGAVR